MPLFCTSFAFPNEVLRSKVRIVWHNVRSDVKSILIIVSKLRMSWKPSPKNSLVRQTWWNQRESSACILIISLVGTGRENTICLALVVRLFSTIPSLGKSQLQNNVSQVTTITLKWLQQYRVWYLLFQILLEAAKYPVKYVPALEGLLNHKKTDASRKREFRNWVEKL